MSILKATETKLLANGDMTIDDFIRMESPQTQLDRVVLKPASLRRLCEFLDHIDIIQKYHKRLGVNETIDYGRSTLILLHGPSGTGKTMTARAMANHTGRPLITFRPGHHRHSDPAFDVRLGVFLKFVEQNKGIGLLDECHDLFDEDSYELSVFLKEIEQFNVTLFLATTIPELLGRALDRRIALKIATTQPNTDQRLKIWQNLIPPALTLADDVRLNQLAENYKLNGGYIKNAILYALNLAIHRSPDRVVMTMADLTKACLIQENCLGPGNSVRKILEPQFSLDDICVSLSDDPKLHAIADRIRVNRLETVNLVISSNDISLAKSVASALASCPGSSITSINMKRFLDSDFAHSRLDPNEILRQVLKAAFESNHPMIIDGLSGYLRDSIHHDDNILIRLLLDYPGLKIIVLDEPDTFLKSFSDDILEHLELKPPCAKARSLLWRRLLTDSGVKLTDGFLSELSRYELTAAGIRMVLKRVKWMKADRITHDDILLAARYVSANHRFQRILF